MKQIIPFKQELLFKTKVSEITSISLEHTLSLKESDLISGEFLITGDYKMTEASINRENFSFKLPFEIALDSRYDINNITIDIDNFSYEVINNESLLVNIDVYFDGEKIIEEDNPIDIKDTTTENNNIYNNTLDRNLESIDTKEYASLDEYKKENVIEPEKVEDDDSNTNIIDVVDDSANNYKETPIPQNIIDTNIFDNNNILVSNKNTTLENNNSTQDDNAPLDFNTKTPSEFNIFNGIDNSDTYITYHVYIVRDGDTIDSIIEKYGVTRDEIANYNDITNINPGNKIIIPNHNE